jgi:hypothetical protein
MASENGALIVPLSERPEIHEMSEREMLEELLRIARTIEAAVIQLNKNPMFASMGGLFR